MLVIYVGYIRKNFYFDKANNSEYFAYKSNHGNVPIKIASGGSHESKA